MDILTLTDAELLDRTERLVQAHRLSTADLLLNLVEIDRRKAHEKRQCVSLFEYCVYRLMMSDGGAFRHIRAARACKAFPPLWNLLRDGSLSLEALVLLHPHATDPDIAVLAKKASGLTTRRLEMLLAERRPPNPERDSIRFAVRRDTPPPLDDSLLEFPASLNASKEMSVPQVAAVASAPAAQAMPLNAPLPSKVNPCSTRTVRFAFTADEDFFRMLSHARSLLRHKYPDGRLEGVLRDALKALLDRKDPMIRWANGARRRRSRSAAPS